MTQPEKRSFLDGPLRVLGGATLGLAVSAGPVIIYTSGVLLKPIAADTGWTRGQISAATACAALTTAIVAPAIGALVDRWGGARVSRVSVVLFAACLAGIALVPAYFPLFIAAFVMTGVLAAGQTPLSYSQIISSSFDRTRGLALAIGLSGMGLGAIVLPPLASGLAEVSGWRTAYAGLGAIVLVVGMIASLLIPAGRPQPSRAGTPAAHESVQSRPAESWTSALREPAFWTMAGAFFLVAMGTNAVVGHLPAILTDGGHSPGAAAGVVSASGVALIIGRLVGGALLDRLSANWVALGFFAAGAAGSLILAASSSLASAISGAALVGLAIGVETDLIAYMVSRRYGLAAFGRLYGVQILCFAIGVGAGPALLGALFDAQSSYTSGLHLMAAACAGGAVAIAIGGPSALQREFDSASDAAARPAEGCGAGPP
jgi:predicted MFS family arabinose efflux permease